MATGLGLSIHEEPENNQYRHGLRVSIDPTTGEFQRPLILPAQAAPVPKLFAMSRGLFDTSKAVEVPSVQASGGYTVNLEHRYRPLRQNTPKTGS